VGTKKNVGLVISIRRGQPPSWSATIRPYSPPASLNQAICFPSGDQTACRSDTPGCAGDVAPAATFSAGTVKSRPVLEQGQVLVGDRRASRAAVASKSVQRGRAQLRSAATDLEPARGAGRHAQLVSSRPARSHDGTMTGAEALHVEVGVERDCFSSPVPGFHDQTLLAHPAPDR
jgi:hypothetical protein